MSDKSNEDGTDEPVTDREGLAATANEESRSDKGPSADTEDVVPADGIVASLIEELQQASLSDEQLNLLRSELGFEHPNSMEVRLRYIQSRMEEFAAYIEGLEDLIDVHGSATAIIDELHGQLDAIAGDFDQLRTEFDALVEDHDAVEGELSVLSESVAKLDQRVATGFEDTRNELVALQETHASDVSQIRAELETAKGDVAGAKQEVTRAERELQSEIDGLRREVTTNTDQRKRLMDVARQLGQLNRSRGDPETSADDPA